MRVSYLSVTIHTLQPLSQGEEMCVAMGLGHGVQ